MVGNEGYTSAAGQAECPKPTKAHTPTIEIQICRLQTSTLTFDMPTRTSTLWLAESTRTIQNCLLNFFHLSSALYPQRATIKMKLELFIILVSTSLVYGFLPASKPLQFTHARHGGLPSLYMSSSSEETPAAFDAYQPTASQTSLEFKDTVVGDGEMAEKGKVLTVAYEGRLMSNGKVFDKGNGYSFRLGEGKVIPGWEKGLKGMRVGGKRTLRVPPGLAYADRGAKDVIPPGAHLEFDCELISIAANPVEEALSQINMQPERIITFVLLLILLAVSPSIHL